MLLSIEIGKNVVALRKMRGLTQEQLALRAEMSVSYLRAIEHGKANPTIKTLVRLSDVLKVHPTLLLALSCDEAELCEELHAVKQGMIDEEQKMVV